MKKILYISTLIATMLTSSCNDSFLDVEPTDAVSEGIIFSTTETADVNMVGVYNALIYYYGAEGYRWIMGPDVMGEDIFVRSTNNYGRFATQIYPLVFTPESSRTTEFWNRTYRVVKSANDIVNQIDDITGVDAEKARIKAEALTARGFSFLKLIRMYGEYAYSQDPDSKGIVVDVNSDMEELIGRSTVKDAYNQIVKDLELAIELYSKPDVATMPKWRFSKQATHAILANAYLDMEQWADAATHAEAARNGVKDGTDLMDEASYISGFNTTGVETIWERAFLSGQTHAFLSVASFAYTDDDGEQGLVFGYNSLRAAQSFVDIFEDTDYRKKLFPKKVADEGVYFTKHRHPDGAMAAGRNIPRIRTAEMYLIEAEAKAELGNDAEAQDLLYTLQSKRDASVSKTTSTGATLVDEVLLERRKELFAEGHRIFDIKRRNLSFMRTGSEQWQHRDVVIKGDDYRLNLPIPLSEINANDAITPSDQNRGYN